jgi:hypothetical protein
LYGGGHHPLGVSQLAPPPQLRHHVVQRGLHRDVRAHKERIVNPILRLRVPVIRRITWRFAAPLSVRGFDHAKTRSPRLPLLPADEPRGSWKLSARRYFTSPDHRERFRWAIPT